MDRAFSSVPRSFVRFECQDMSSSGTTDCTAREHQHVENNIHTSEDIQLRRDAEGEMGRKLPDDVLYDSDQELGRYRYDAVKTLTQGRSKGYLITCAMRRERSCLREVMTKDLLGSKRDGLGIVKMSARGLVMLLTSDEGQGDCILETVGLTYDRYAREGAPKMKFTHRISPVLRTFLYEEETVHACLERAGKGMAEDVMKYAKVFGKQEERERMSFAVTFHARGAISNKRLPCIQSIAKGFSAGCSGRGDVRVDLARPDVVITLDLVTVMGREFVLVGVCPSDWCVTKPRIRLKSLCLQASGSKHAMRSPEKDEEVMEAAEKRQKV